MTAALVPVESGTDVLVCSIDTRDGWCETTAIEVLYLKLPGEDVETYSPRCRKHPAGKTADAIRRREPLAEIRIVPAPHLLRRTGGAR